MTTNTTIRPARVAPGAEKAEPVLPTPEVQSRRVRSDVLLRGDRILEIAHGGEIYRLQATRLGKLILTK